MAVLKGDKKVYAIRFEDEVGTETMRVLYQTGGSRTKTRDEVEVSTKDIDGTGYGKKKEVISFEGLVSEDDGALIQIEKCIDDALFAEILEINVDTMEAVAGNYMLSSLAFDYPDDDNSTYTVDASLTGNTSRETLTEVPEGATEI